ncbi:hypothetical protein FRB90_011571 [Tulasnella sp. 427]|nr:hypothetical protein FRB90_011571 [Tulasnella sp. 427]
MTSRQKTESQTQYHHYPALPTRHSARTLQQSSHPYIQTRPSRASRASTGSTSRSVGSGSSSSEVEISFYGYVETVLDALLLVESPLRTFEGGQTAGGGHPPELEASTLSIANQPTRNPPISPTYRRALSWPDACDL